MHFQVVTSLTVSVFYQRVEQMKNLQVSKVSDSQKSPEEVNESANQRESVETDTQPSEITETHARLTETVKKLQEENKELQDKLTQRE